VSRLLNRKYFTSTLLLLGGDYVNDEMAKAMDDEDKDEMLSAEENHYPTATTPFSDGSSETTNLESSALTPTPRSEQSSSGRIEGGFSDWRPPEEGSAARTTNLTINTASEDGFGGGVKLQPQKPDGLLQPAQSQQQQQLSSADFDIFGMSSSLPLSPAPVAWNGSDSRSKDSGCSLEGEILASLQKASPTDTPLPSGLSSAAESILANLPDLSFMLSKALIMPPLTGVLNQDATTCGGSGDNTEVEDLFAF